jgi:hypothetical protein
MLAHSSIVIGDEHHSMAANSRFAHYVATPVTRMIPLIASIAVFVVLFIGWSQREEEYLIPASGLGYWLGILGSLMMLLLLLYSVRKRLKALRILGSIPTWFRIHMFLGTLGPVLVMFHSNFRLGALNSNVALFAMLTVAASGVIGRYIYGKIHMGLYGRKALAQEILADMQLLKQELGAEIAAADHMIKRLDALGQGVFNNPPKNALQSLWTGGALVVQSWFLRGRLRAEASRLIQIEAKVRGWPWLERRRRLSQVNQALTRYINALLKAAELRFYERLFSLWHVLHLPLFYLMVMTALVHVWATHSY